MEASLLLRPLTFTAAVLSLAVFAQPTWSATTLDHSTLLTESNGVGLSEGSLAAYGQTFTVGADNTLTDFTFYDSIGSAGATLQLTVANWTGTEPGSVLFTSDAVPTTVYPDYHAQAFTFDTGDLQLVTGYQYVAYLRNASELGGTITWLSHDGLFSSLNLPTGPDYAGGYYVNQLNSDPTWRLYNDPGQGIQSSFKADFISPEPSSIAVFGIAVSCLLARVAILRRRRSSLSSQ